MRKIIAALLFLCALLMGLSNFIAQPVNSTISFSSMIEALKNKQISKVIVYYRHAYAKAEVIAKTGIVYYLKLPKGFVSKELQHAAEKGEIILDIQEENVGMFFKLSEFVSSLFRLIWPIGLAFLMWQQLSFFQKPRFAARRGKKISLSDVVGIDDAKNELMDVVNFLKSPAKYFKMGAKIPKGVLLMGPPGTGKTMLAKALAGDANVPFFACSGSDFIEVFVGVGASRIRELFRQAKKHPAAIIFIDEVEGMGRTRRSWGSNSESDNTLNQLLTEMDGFEENRGIVVIAATNDPEQMDAALLRPGRFDRKIKISLPDVEGRKKIIQVHSRNKLIDPDVDFHILAKATPLFSGADLANLANEATLIATNRKHKSVTMQDFEKAKDKMIMGIPNLGFRDEEERKLVAYHEAGHALISYLNEHADAIHKATIVPRGMSRGAVFHLVEKENMPISKERLEARISVCFGGRLAEILVFGEDKMTAGASSDIQNATKIAYMMVTQWGMSPNIGPVFYDMESYAAYKPSQEYTRLIDKEIKEILNTHYQKTLNILQNNLSRLESLANALLEKETLDAKEIAAVLG